MDPSGFDELVNVLRTTSATITTVAVVSFFATIAVMLWVWRRIALEDDE